MTHRVYVRRRRQLPTSPGQHPGAERLSVDIQMTYPAGATVALVRQLLDNAYLDALTELDQQQAAIQEADPREPVSAYTDNAKGVEAA